MVREVVDLLMILYSEATSWLEGRSGSTGSVSQPKVASSSWTTYLVTIQAMTNCTYEKLIPGTECASYVAVCDVFVNPPHVCVHEIPVVVACLLPSAGFHHLHGEDDRQRGAEGR